MSKHLLPHWVIMKEYDQKMFENVSAWRDYFNNNPILPAKYKELMMVAMCCVIRFKAGIKVHAEYALEEGATKEELFAVVAQTILIGGVPAYREGILTIQGILEDK